MKKFLNHVHYLILLRKVYKGSEALYAKVLVQGAELLFRQEGDHYIRHEHLEDENISSFTLMRLQQKRIK